MPVFHVEKAIVIEAPVADCPAVRDFKQWPAWSPWLIAEPETKLTYAADGNRCDWDGQVTGAGSMEVVEDNLPQSIECRLTFLRPFQSENTTTAFSGIEAAMNADFQKIGTWLSEGGVTLSGPPLAIYHKVDFVRDQVPYTLAGPVQELPAPLPDWAVTGELPDTRVYTIVHHGPYRHLGTAWAAGMMHGKAKTFRADGQRDNFEFYLTDPDQVSSEEAIQTKLCFPVK